MDEPGKYLIHARITASGVVERNDVVGAVFGQTEGLLGDEFDLRSLQMSQRVGRIDVDVQSEGGVSDGTIQIASAMDRVETAVLAASLETIDRIGPCRASVEVDRIEDIRAAKRRSVYDRAQELVARGFEDVGVGGQDLVEAVREATTPVEIDDFAGYPAGPDIESREEVIIVEGRADVTRLLQFGITNVLGVEGTDVPSEIAEFTRDHTVTAFFDGDRGGDLLLLELAQIGDVDYVTFAPRGKSVEDLSHGDILDALAEKVPYEETASAVERDLDEESAATSLESRLSDVLSNGSTLTALGPEYTVLATGEDLEDLIEDQQAATIIVVDGPIDQRSVDLAAAHDIGMVIGTSLGSFTKRPRDVRVFSVDDILESPQLPEQ